MPTRVHIPQSCLTSAECTWLCGAVVLGTLLRLPISHFGSTNEPSFSLPWFASVATIPSVWWIARRWFAPDSGIVVAWAVAMSELHVTIGSGRHLENLGLLGLLWAIYGLWWSLTTTRNRALTMVIAVLSGVSGTLAVKVSPAMELPLGLCLLGATVWLIAGRSRVTLLRSSASIFGLMLGTILGLSWFWQITWTVPDFQSAIWAKQAIKAYETPGRDYAGWLTLFGLCGPTCVTALLMFVATRTLAGPHRLGAILVNIVILAVRPNGWLYVLTGLGLVAAFLVWRKRHQEGEEPRGLAAIMLLAWLSGSFTFWPLQSPGEASLLALVTGSLLAGSIFWRRGWANLTSAESSGFGTCIAPVVTLIVGWLVASMG